MAEKIRLENIVSRGYDRQSGKQVMEETLEFACGNCRHLVNVEDKFCWNCGTPLEASSVVEHWYRGQKLTNTEFSKVKHSD